MDTLESFEAVRERERERELHFSEINKNKNIICEIRKDSNRSLK